MARYDYLQPDCCAAAAIRHVVTHKDPMTKKDSWPWDFRGLTDAHRHRWATYREKEIERFARAAGKALAAHDTKSWGAWLDGYWSLYREFCLQYADTLDRPRAKRRPHPANRTVSPEDQARIVEAYDNLRWHWRDNWNEEEDGSWPGHTYHLCAGHVIDALRLCSRCKQAHLPLPAFLSEILACIATDDLDALTAFVRDLGRDHTCQGGACIYVIQMEGHDWLKIGHTTQSHHKAALVRTQTLQTGTPVPLRLVKTYPCRRAQDVEWFMHTLLATSRRTGEWAFQEATLHLNNPTYFMTPAQADQYEEWREERRNEALDEWGMFDDMGLDAEEFVPIEPDPANYHHQEHLPPYMRMPRKKGNAREDA